MAMGQERINRVRHHEALLNEAKEVLSAAENAVDSLEALQPKIRELEKYYTSRKWRNDFEASERGEFPADLPCGVLSEDGINDVLDDNLELIRRMRTILTEREEL